MNPRLLLLWASLWLVVVIAGTLGLMAYDYTPGRDGGIPATWPSSSKIPRAPDLPTLVMFAHPQCPCTRASIGELAVLMAHSQDLARVYVEFIRPEGSGPDWLHTDLWRSAEEIPGVLVRADERGREAGYFQATTSGRVVLYDARGKLLFTGGITSSRGHDGDSAGLSALMKLLHHEATSTRETPAFGCSLLDPPDVAQASAWTR
jgi:hypothetical protein